MNGLAAIAIDGPAASGKTTVGQMLADALGYLFLDTGVMYRALTLAVRQQNIDPADADQVTHLAETMSLEINADTAPGDGRTGTVLLDGVDVTWAIRSPDVNAHVSAVSTHRSVRAALVARQQTIARQGRVVMVGRDIGTVVLPNAPLKLYIVASAEERARRRWRERQQFGETATYEAILADVNRRDAIDSSREHSPLRPAPDAILIDTTEQPPAAVVAAIMGLERLTHRAPPSSA